MSRPGILLKEEHDITFQATIQFNFDVDFPGASCDQIQKGFLGRKLDGMYYLDPARNAAFAVSSTFCMRVIVFFV